MQTTFFESLMGDIASQTGAIVTTAASTAGGSGDKDGGKGGGLGGGAVNQGNTGGNSSSGPFGLSWGMVLILGGAAIYLAMR